MSCQLTIRYSDSNEELFFILNDRSFQKINIDTNDNETYLHFSKNNFQSANHLNPNRPNQNPIILNKEDFLAYLFPREEIIFEDKKIETLIFSYLLPREISIVSQITRELPLD